MHMAIHRSAGVRYVSRGYGFISAGDRGTASGEPSRTHAAMTTVRTQLSSGGTPPRTRSADAEARGARHHYQAIVDVHLLLMRDRRVLLGRRANTGYGDGAYEPPSSRLTERETIVEAAIRIAAAQTGIELRPCHLSLAHVMHDVSGAGRIAFFLAADGWDGEPAGPAASYSDFAWFDLDDLPANMIDRARVALRSCAAGAAFSTYPAFGQ